MQNKILIEGDDKDAKYSIACTRDFMCEAVIHLFESITKIDPDGLIALHILDMLADIVGSKYIKKWGDKNV